MLRALATFGALILTVLAAVTYGAYLALPHAFPALINPTSPLDATTQAQLLKLLSGVIGAMVTSIFAAGASTLNIRHQLRANQELEDHKGGIIADLDERKNVLAAELETHKNGLTLKLEEKKNALAGQLDEDHQRLEHELGLRRLRVDLKSVEIGALKAALNVYRVALGALQRGQFDADDAAVKAEALDVAKNCLQPNTPTYMALDAFRQRGLFLQERAERITTPDGQRRLWREPSKAQDDQDEPLGMLLARDGERALALIETEFADLLAARG